MFDTLRETFNGTMDILGPALRRFFELPILVLLTIFVAPFALVSAILRRRRMAGRHGGRLVAVAAILSFLLLLDRKLALILGEVRALRVESAQSRLGPRSNEGHAPSTPLFDEAALRSWGRKRSPDFDLRVATEARGVVIASMVWPRPEEARVVCAVIDLEVPEIEVVVTPHFGAKTLTSSFATENRCTVAINGEAGISPQPDSGLGSWTGNWVSRGIPILLEDGPDRPFMSFDRDRRGRYSPAAEVARTALPEWRDVIWGRGDLLIDGEPRVADGDAGPRTCMGLDATGRRLFLLVADGRQPGLSLGISLPFAAEILRLLGAENAMWCDQGGSSCLFLASQGGLATSPSDGVERPTYSHFGVRAGR